MRFLLRLVMVVLILAAFSVVAPTPASAGHSCSTVAKIVRLSDTSYNIGGNGSCNVNVSSLTLSCKPIHRHSTFWHSHSGITFPPSSNTNRIPASGDWWWGPLGGTNNDTYKTSCTGTYISHGQSVIVTNESFQVTL